MKTKKLISSVLVFLLTSIAFMGCSQKQESTTKSSSQDKKELLIYCGAGLNKPMEEIGKSFEKKYGVKIQYTYANASQLIGQMEVSHKGDLCVLPSDEDYNTANKKNLTLEKKDLAYHIPVIAVPKGNPAGITNIKDLSKSGVKIILGDPQTSPLGKLAANLFAKAGIGQQAKNNTVSTVTTVNEIVTFLSAKKADASIIWEDNALNAAKNIDIVQIPEKENLIKVIPIAALKTSKETELCKNFIDFTASDEGKAIFVKYNLKPLK